MKICCLLVYFSSTEPFFYVKKQLCLLLRSFCVCFLSQSSITEWSAGARTGQYCLIALTKRKILKFKVIQCSMGNVFSSFRLNKFRFSNRLKRNREILCTMHEGHIIGLICWFCNWLKNSIQNTRCLDLVVLIHPQLTASVSRKIYRLVENSCTATAVNGSHELWQLWFTHTYMTMLDHSYKTIIYLALAKLKKI